MTEQPTSTLDRLDTICGWLLCITGLLGAGTVIVHLIVAIPPEIVQLAYNCMAVGGYGLASRLWLDRRKP